MKIILEELKQNKNFSQESTIKNNHNLKSILIEINIRLKSFNMKFIDLGILYIEKSILS